jgi:hypothetical protein
VEPQDLQRTLRRLAPEGWLDAARRFATSLRGAGHEPGRLLVVGTPQDEPWHLAAHLADAARWRGLPSLQPTLVRWQVPDGARPHLSVGLDAVHTAARGTTVLVAAPTAADDDRLLERLDDARRGGATLFALHAGGGSLDELAHVRLPLPRGMPAVEGFEAASHVVATVTDARRRGLPWRRRP